MLLLYTYNPLLIVLGYVTFYYGILTTYNVAAIYILTKAGSKDQINSINESNSKLFGLSEQTLKYLTALTIGTYKIRQLSLITNTSTNNNSLYNRYLCSVVSCFLRHF